MVEETPEALTSLIRDVLDAELTARAENERQQRDASELAERRRRDAAEAQEKLDAATRARLALSKSREQRRMVILKWAGGVVGTLTTLTIGWLFHLASLKAEHALGVSEGKREAPTVIVPMPSSAVANIAASASATGASPSAPAAVVPSKISR
jgi:hypothetical protein